MSVNCATCNKSILRLESKRVLINGVRYVCKKPSDVETCQIVKGQEKRLAIMDATNQAELNIKASLQKQFDKEFKEYIENNKQNFLFISYDGTNIKYYDNACNLLFLKNVNTGKWSGGKEKEAPEEKKVAMVPRRYKWQIKKMLLCIFMSLLVLGVSIGVIVCFKL